MSCPRLRHAVGGYRYGHQIDKVSGKLARRPELDRALLVARDSDQLMVTKLDRLDRSLEHLINLSKGLQERGVDLVVLDQGIDTSTAVGRMFFQIPGAIAEFEHALMSERTMDGLAAARARGRTGGQKPKLTPRRSGLSSRRPPLPPSAWPSPWQPCTPPATFLAAQPNRLCPTPPGIGMKARRAREPARTMTVTEGEHPAKAAAGRALPNRALRLLPSELR